MTNQHLDALLTALALMPEGPDKQCVREIAVLTKQAIDFAASLAFEQRLFAVTPQDIVTAQDAEAGVEVASFAASEFDREFTRDEKIDGLEVLINAGVSALSKAQDLPGLDQVLAFFDELVDADVDLSAESPVLTNDELVLLGDVFDFARNYLRVARAPSDVPEVVEAVSALEDRVWGLV